VTINGLVCGASVPFQFRHLYENELCAVEEQDGLMVVRSRTAFTEEKLREVTGVHYLINPLLLQTLTNSYYVLYSYEYPFER
jgi:hypothetical protein